VRRARGFTLIELLIVIAIVAVLVTISVPSLLAAREPAAQAVVIATLRNLVAAQAQFQQSGAADEDRDGTGEYGGFAEMSGQAAGRMSAPLVPPLLSSAFRAINANAEVQRSGYLYKAYLPGVGGAGVGEDPVLGFVEGAGQVPNLSESTWCCYAWPVSYRTTRGKTSFVNQGGDVLACEVSDYSGTGNGPPPDRAYRGAGSNTGPADVSGAGQNPDGQLWKPIR
jgi:prepilin-type N-terminal cleavage/methylation domain-containing protein